MSDLSLIQTPPPGTSRVRFCGDTVFFSLDLPENISGKAWIRTNLGDIRTVRDEIIQAVAADEPVLGRAWYDIPMTQVHPRRFEAVLALCDTGHFEAKCFFMASDSKIPIWPQGPNVILNVEPADMSCANIIYNAFVRQFGPNKSGTFSLDSVDPENIQRLDQKGYTVIPPSGTFRDLIKALDFIFETLGCRILHLLPINPTPTTYGRMGRFGSPYAALDFTGIDPALAVFDPKATPLEQFVELVDAVHARKAKIIIDLAPNHTGWAAELHETHPQWLVRDDEGTIQAPGAWGVVWEDLTRLDYTSRDLWKYMADVFLLWCSRGVDGFRCDAGYMIPVPAWNFIVATVRQQFPDTIFFLEGLGGKISVTKEILSTSNFNWAYSELFQNDHRNEVTSCFELSDRISSENGLMVHFAETHDNNRLAARAPAYAAMRTALCALISHCGGFGFANGVEWFATEKINVHDACSLNWGADINQVEQIGRLNLLLKFHPAFFAQTRLRMIQEGEGDYIAVLRHHLPSGKRLLVLINLGMDHPVQAIWHPAEFVPDLDSYTDLLSGHTLAVKQADERMICDLPPGQCYCLSPAPEDMDLYIYSKHHALLPDPIRQQYLQSIVLEIYRFFTGSIKLYGVDIDDAVCRFENDPERFCRSLNPDSRESRIVTWNWPEDSRRQVMIPPDHLLMIRSAFPFRARIAADADGREINREIRQSLAGAKNGYFAVFTSHPDPEHHYPATLKLSVFQGHDDCTHMDAPLLYLCRHPNLSVKKSFDRKNILQSPLRFLDTNGRGGMMRADARWASIESRYDALLSANLNPDCPDNRWMMLIRCRAWIVFQGFSTEISADILKRCSFDPETGCCWDFAVPAGQGQYIDFRIIARMLKNKNQIMINFMRQASSGQNKVLPDHYPIRLIIRPDIDDRSFHNVTKAYTGPEHQWPAALDPADDGFTFTPHPDRILRVKTSAGEFIKEPEWHYMVYLPADAERGMDAHTDLFSPGYFSAYLKGNETTKLSAAVLSPGYGAAPLIDSGTAPLPFPSPKEENIADCMKQALSHYLVQRESHKSVIAGYPWFLDWGRDTLIVSRGMIAAGFISETRMILEQFGKFESRGTLPNVIFGNDTRNRDTVDAPLWFAVACRDLVRKDGDEGFLDKKCGGRPLRDIIASIVDGYIAGTPNGIIMDPATGLVFSPSHFTWMDTNFPAGTPREGYPIEIQALWYHTLEFMSKIDPPEKQDKWKNLAAQVSASIQQFFYLPEAGYLSDCLHSDFAIPAKKAAADDALRPNQLFAVTLGAVKDPKIMTDIMHACSALLIPGSIRSLADQPVKKPLEIKHHDQILNDPCHPYQGIYSGDEDTRRKPAYHNGTAWAWVFPSFCEAWAMVFGKQAHQTARAFLTSSADALNTGCAGQLPEIMDGNYPHQQKGCDAQAWSVSEWLRVWLKLTQIKTGGNQA